MTKQSKNVPINLAEALIINSEKLMKSQEFQMNLLREKIELLEKIINILKS